MAHYAQIDGSNKVIRVLVIEQDVIDTGLFGNPHSFIQTSYNTYGGVHYGPDGNPDGGIALRKNYAVIGYTYDPDRDAFYATKPYQSWILNEDTCIWEAPTTKPNDGRAYSWDEPTTSWVVIQ